MALKSLSSDDKASILKAPKLERGTKIKALKTSLREAGSSGLLSPHLKNSLSVGLKQCMKDLERDNLTTVVFDTSVNASAIRGVVDGGKIPNVGIPDLGKVLKETIGFPGIVIGIKKNPDPHFLPLASILGTEKTRQEIYSFNVIATTLSLRSFEAQV